MIKRVSMKDVADRAGVSIATVSHVLNQPGRVTPQTTASVVRAMNDLGFVRNQLARQLRTGTGTTIGMIVLNVANPFFANLAHACEKSAEETGQSILLASSDQLPHREDRYLALLEEHRVNGLLVAPVGGPSVSMARLRDRGMPIVLFGNWTPAFCSVVLDDEEGGYLVAKHLIESGRRRLAFIGGPIGQVNAKWRGVQRAVLEGGGTLVRRVDTRDQTSHDGRAAVEELLADGPDVEGIIAVNDLTALGVLAGLSSAGLRVPDDVALTGYDDIEFAASASVPLTTVRQPIDEIAREALSLLRDEAERPHEHRNVVLTPELIVRDSTA
ncbi:MULTISPECIES: LacI family DNA-binding transcriptional regulator [unclassified Microbacterium]|uniref:LacI family DNA-binding transcriptional regulator n=1 Tax=unclassified Microbacterium TaxID=2609290 RepID=UPI0016052C93|nr:MULTISPECIES: LacI family DNA-binding transcriptional regulator [unclassified Microbacterium]QNA93972.1 LacI family transcriptional regulator [Microbacterium sp. Se63.02b]QYM64296.1 LacI family transcriptional regulator [Microbacterium sp. Se5.02b]